MWEELGKAHGAQGGKQERVCHLVSKLKLDLANKKMGEEMIIVFPVTKHSCQTKAKKVGTNEAHESKKLAKLVTMAELGSTKKLPKMPKGKREETFGSFKSRSGEGGSSTKKEIL